MPTTLTLILQIAFAVSAAPLRLIVELPALAVISVTGLIELHVVVTFGVAAMTKPPGRTSEKLTPDKAVALGFVMSKVSVLAVPCTMVGGVNAFASVGSSGRGQPFMIILSRNIVAAGLLPPSEEILKVVVEPSANAGMFVIGFQAVLLLLACG